LELLRRLAAICLSVAISVRSGFDGCASGVGVVAPDVSLYYRISTEARSAEPGILKS
jgi:hypothetical protein